MRRFSYGQFPPRTPLRHAMAGGSTPLALVAIGLLTTGCLAGPSTALGGGPIGRAPDLRSTALLPIPDSTRGVGFVLRGNRRDLVDQVRIDLNAASRAYERLLGERPVDADVYLEADARDVRVTIRLPAEGPTTFSTALQRDERGGPRIPEALRVAAVVDVAMARAWLSNVAQHLAHEPAPGTPWMAREAMPAWLRVGLLQAVGGHRWHDLWLAQLAQQRDALPPLAALFEAGACDAACLEAFRVDGDAPRPSPAADGSAPPVAPPRRGRLPLLEGRTRFAAMSFSVVQFMARREGPTFMRTLVSAAISGGNVHDVLASARSFTADPADIERQWKVWLAPFGVVER